jgi:glycosyltransferase involved in cell wall biosynthesis
MSAAAPLVTVVVPAWNESANLSGCLGSLRGTLAHTDYEIVIVDDGSTDDTGAVARRLADEDPTRTRVAVHETNQGLGGALRTGFAAARGQFVTCCPADFRTTPEDWAPFAAAIGKADVVVGCRVRREGYNPLMRINAWLYPRLVRLLFGLRLRDVNWISVCRSDLVRRVTITQRGIPMLTEILVKLRDLGATFVEVDCRMQPRLVGVPSASRFRVMWRTLTGLFRLWWSYRRPASADPNLAAQQTTKEDALS